MTARSSRRGAAGQQYAIIVGLIAVVALFAVAQLGRNITTLFTGTGNTLTGVVNAAGGSGSGSGEGGGQPTISPPDIPGLVGWWDPSNAGSVTQSSGAVSAIADLSGNGRGLSQGIAARQPTLAADGNFNNRQVLGFSAGSQTQILRNGNSPLTAGDGSFTFAVVWRSLANPNSQVIMEQWNSGGTPSHTRASLMTVSTSGGRYGFCGEAIDLQHTLATYSPGTKYRSIMRVNGLNVRMRSNGTDTSGTMSNPLTLAAGVFSLGARSSPNTIELFSGQIAEVMVYDRDLTDDETGQLDAYLAGKW